MDRLSSHAFNALKRDAEERDGEKDKICAGILCHQVFDGEWFWFIP
jgi:hypothetical protein